MPERRDDFEPWLRQRLAATLDDATRAPRRRLLLPGGGGEGAAAERAVARRSGFVAGVLTASVVFGMVWAGITVLGPNHTGRSGAPAGRPTPTPSPSAAAAPGVVGASLALPGSAFTVAVGAGAVWVPDDADHRLLRIDPSTAQPAASIDLGDRGATPGNGFAAVAVGGGSVWVTSPTSDALLRVDPSANRVSARIPLGVSPTSLAADADSVWVSSAQGDVVLRVAVATGAVLARVAVPHPGPVALGGSGLWVVSLPDGLLSRIDPRTDRVVHVRTAAPALDYSVGALAPVGDGVWLRDLADSSVDRLDAATGRLTDRIGVGGSPAYGVQDPLTLAAGFGALWTTVNQGLVRVDLSTQATALLPLPHATGVAVGAGAVWVVSGEAKLVRVTPRG